MFVALLATTSCEDFLNITPDGQSKRDDQLSTEQGIEDAMYGVYSQMRSPSLYGQELYFKTLEVMAHNLYSTDNDDIKSLANFEYDNTYVKSMFEGIWTAMYKNISNVNSVLNSPLVADADKYPFTIYRGEALGLRAFMHFDLVRLFAEQYTVNPQAKGIPYATEFSLKTPAFESLKKNYEHILADLLEADSLLADEDKYADERAYMLDRQIHFNRYAVWATLARVYLTMGNNELAAQYAQKAIANNGKYTLKEKTKVKDDLAGVLSTKECLFGVYYSGWYATVSTILQQLNPGASLYLRKNFQEIYEKDASGSDSRFSAYFSEDKNGDNIIYRLCKFTDVYEKNNTVANRPASLILGINMIRIPEMHYILAEALLASDYDTALSHYDAVRMSRGLEPLEGKTLTQELINDERFREMIGEGQTFFNMKRLNLNIPLATDASKYRTPNEGIYIVPIPDIEIENRN
jgi:tetratricopeptide (TPR) repeat protein